MTTAARQTTRSRCGGQRRGRVLLLTGRVQDNSAARVTLTARVGTRTYTRTVTPGEAVVWALPLPDPTTPVTVRARDAAGNERDVPLR